MMKRFRYLAIAALTLPAAAFASVPDTVTGNSRGYLTTPQELQAIKAKADQNIEPYKTAVNKLLTDVGNSGWPYSITAGVQNCSDSNTPYFLSDGSHRIYAQALAYGLTGNTAYASFVAQRLREFMTTTDWYTTTSSDYSGGNQCILNLSWYVPALVQSADLIEDYSGWTVTDKHNFQAWLESAVFHRVAWASRWRVNNWGGSGSLCALTIADYLWDSNLTLHEIKPNALSLTPAQAFADHRLQQLRRMSSDTMPYGGTPWTTHETPGCTHYGIRDDGGIPEELRRGASGCDATYAVPPVDASWTYTELITQFFVATGELLLRRGDSSVFDNAASDGSGSILNALLFIMHNTSGGVDHSGLWETSHVGTLEVAYRYYRDPYVWTNMNQCGGRCIDEATITSSGTNSGSRYVNFGTVTHGFATNENPGLPPTVPPPGAVAAPPDTTAPVISAVAAGPVYLSSATLTWTTDEASSSQVEYGLTASYGSSSALAGALVTSHSVVVTGLNQGTLYHFRVKSSDASANQAVSSDGTFTTVRPDTVPPLPPKNLRVRQGP